MLRWHPSALAALALAGLAASQTPSQAPVDDATGSISGRTVDAVTGQPVLAMIFAQRVGPRSGPCGFATAPDGRFVCSHLAQGDYALSASVDGYARADYGARSATDDTWVVFNLDRAEHVTDLTLRLWPDGSISGHVTGPDGLPDRGAAVSALRRMPIVGSDRFVATRPTNVDKAGGYHLDVLPGEYIVAVTSPQHSYPATFYPGTPAIGAARLIKVESGADLKTIDVHRTSAAGFSVSGRFLSPQRSQQTLDRGATTVRLFPAEAPQTPMGFDVASAEVFARPGGGGAGNRGGAFSLSNVPPGRYVLRVVAFPDAPDSSAILQNGSRLAIWPDAAPIPSVATLWAELLITVTDHDAVDLPITLREAARIRGRVIFQDASPSMTSAPFAPIVVHRVDGRDDGNVPLGGNEPDGAFRSVGLAPGAYALFALSPSAATSDHWMMQSVTVGGRDVTGRPFDVGSVDLVDAVVTMRRSTGVLSGAVTDGAGHSRQDASIFVLPVDATRWISLGLAEDMTGPREVRPNRRGVFRVELAPGDYLVAGATERPGWRRAEVIADLARTATRISIAGGEARTLDLTVR